MRKATIRKAKLKKYLAKYENALCCSLCREYNGNNFISCAFCSKWFHASCVKLSKKCYNKLKTSNSYACNECLVTNLPFYGCENVDLYPCGKCKREVDTNSINCSTCGTWYHYACTNMSEDEFKSVHYVFCNKKCENQRSIPENFT